MGFLDASNFRAPNLNTAVPSLGNFLDYKRSQEEQQQQFQKDLMDHQARQRMQDITNTMQMQRAQPTPPLNVLPPQGMITDVDKENFKLEGERNRLLADRNKYADENNDEKNRIAQQNANTKTTLANDPNLVQMKTEGGDVYYIDKKSGRIVDTKVPEGTLTGAQQFQNKQTLQMEGEKAKESLENTRQGNRVTNLNTRGTQSINNIDEKGKQDRLTRAVPSPNANSTLPSQQFTAEKIKANHFIQTNPDLGKFVTIDPNTGLVQVAPPATGSSMFGQNKGPSQEQYHQILDAVFGSQRPSYQAKPDAPDTTTTQPAASTDVFVSKNGQRFKVNNPTQLKDLLANGYTQVK